MWYCSSVQMNQKRCYELIRFKEITSESDILEIPEVKKYYNKIKHSADMYYFILKSNKVIGHSVKTFINHVEQLMISIIRRNMKTIYFLGFMKYLQTQNST